jgi:hypothetical protein
MGSRHVAVDAALVVETHLTGAGEPVARTPAGAQQAGLRRGQAQPMAFGELALGHSVEVAGAQDQRVIGGQFTQHPLQATP